MKKIHYHILSLFCVLVLMSACSDEQESTGVGNIQTIVPTINPLNSNEWVLLQPEEGEDPYLFRLNWSQARFVYESNDYAFVSEVNYEVEMDLSDNEFSNPVVVAATSKLYIDMYTLELKSVMEEILGQGSDNPENVSVRIKVITEYGVAYSEAIPLVITSYIYKNKKLAYIYLLGDMNGWNNTNTDFVMFRNNSDPEDETYTYTGRLAAGTYFKFIPEESLGTYQAYCRKDDNSLVYETSDGGAFFNETEGYVTITLNLKELTYTIENYDASEAKIYNTLGPIGGFCDWNNEPPMTKSAYDPHQWHIAYDFTVSTACKFRGDTDWANNWGGSDADFPYGKAVFDGSGATIHEPGMYDVYFNDLTGHYVIKKKQ